MAMPDIAADTAVAEEKLNFKKIFPIFIIVLIDLLGVTIIIPLMPLYAASFGASAVMIGLLGATYPLMQFIGAPILGRLSDRYGRKPVLVISQIGTLIGFLVLGFSNALWMLFLSRIIDGLSGANISTAQAAISDSTSEKTRTQGLGLLGAAFGLGFVVGPLIAFVSLFASGNDYRVPAFVAAGFSLLSILLTWFLFDETLPKERRGARLGSNFLSGQYIPGTQPPGGGFLADPDLCPADRFWRAGTAYLTVHPEPPGAERGRKCGDFCVCRRDRCGCPGRFYRPVEPPLRRPAFDPGWPGFAGDRPSLDRNHPPPASPLVFSICAVRGA